MSVNGTKPKFLEPYKDEEMLFEALLMYANHRHMYAKVISEKGYLNSDNEPVTEAEISFAYQAAAQADRLVDYAKAKVESPIVQLQ